MTRLDYSNTQKWQGLELCHALCHKTQAGVVFAVTSVFRVGTLVQRSREQKKLGARKLKTVLDVHVYTLECLRGGREKLKASREKAWEGDRCRFHEGKSERDGI